MKKLFVMLSVISMLTLLAQGVLAAPDSNESTIVQAKKALVNEFKHEFIANLTEAEINKKDYAIQLLLNKAASNEIPKSEIDKQLESMKVHKLVLPQEESIGILSQPSDVSLNAVSIYYDSSTSRWHVTGGGSWSNNNWNNDHNGWFIGYVGESKNIGGYDTVGITYYGTGGTYNTSVKSSMGYWHDGAGNNWSSYTPSHGDGSLGVAFDFQDQVYIQSIDIWGNPTVRYRGFGYAATVTYDSNFVNYNGKARTFYGHTWNSTSIDSVSFSGSGSTFGVNINFSSTSNRFPAYNNSDTNF
jgi:hypothetical protein